MENMNDLISTIIEYFDYLMQPKEVGVMNIISDNVGVIVSSLVTLATVFFSIVMSKTDYRRKNKDKEYDKYSKELEEFYYPVLYLLGLNTSLYSCFALEQKKANEDFRTLIALIDQQKFSETDEKILEEIITNNEKINKLILEKGLYVEKQEVRQKLIQLSTHYTIISLAYENKIKEHRVEYDKMVYPRDINDCINTEIKNIEEKLRGLR